MKKLTKQSNSKLSEAEKLCFRQAMQELNVKPLKNNNDEILSNLKNDSKKIAPYPVFTEQKFYAEQQNSHNLINFSLQNLEDFSDFDYFDDFRKNGVQLQVLKNLTKLFLQNHSEVLAFCYAKPNQGGEGAVIALLRN